MRILPGALSVAEAEDPVQRCVPCRARAACRGLGAARWGIDVASARSQIPAKVFEQRPDRPAPVRLPGRRGAVGSVSTGWMLIPT